MFKIVAFLSLFLAAVPAQALSDIELIFEADDFVGGLPVNQAGVIRFTVINHGPDDLISSQELIRIDGFYNYVISDIGFLYDFDSHDSDCHLAFIHIDPPPPVNNYTITLMGGIHKNIPSGSSVTCEFITSVPGVGISDMMWRVNLMHGITDPDMSNNTQQFTFRGLPARVPVNHQFILLMLGVMMIVSAWYYRRLSNLNSSS